MEKTTAYFAVIKDEPRHFKLNIATVEEFKALAINIFVHWQPLFTQDAYYRADLVLKLYRDIDF